MTPRCDFKSFNECACDEQCAQIIVDRAPLIRPERQDIKTVIAFGVLVAMLAFGGAHILNHYEKQAEYAGRV